MTGWSLDAVGWVRVATFLPIVVCSVIGFGLTLAKWWQTRPRDVAAERAHAAFRRMVRQGDYGKVLELDPGTSLPTRLGLAVLRQAGAPRSALKDHAELVGRQAVRQLEYGLGGLALIATLGPLFGLLGTVVGIIMIFGQLTAPGGFASPQQLAGGIGTALHTTVTGLVVGVLAMVSHRLIAARVDRQVADLEAATLEVIELVSGDEP